ncbi:MAG: general secretion pathway protein GspB [Methylococcaceae bacterium]|jgi:general secretion pathway protein B
MSFILNALRKSEQERQIVQSETVTDKILLHQPPQKRNKTGKFYVFLVTGNVLLIACLFWFIQKNAVPTPDQTTQPVSKALPAQKAKDNAIVLDIVTQPEKPVQKTEVKSTSIAEWVEKQKPEKIALTKKPTADATRPLPITNKPVLPEPAPIEIETAANLEPIPPETIPVKKGPPFLSDLPYDFRQTVPKLTINVFVYSEHPEDCFVMIDMVKYKSGQQIKDAMVLKEIRPDSLVIVYQNREFQIERP